MAFRINGTHISVESVLGWSALVGGPDLRAFATEQVAIAQAAEARGLSASGEEIRELFRELRYIRRLESGDALRQWMQDMAVDTEMIQEACRNLVLRRKLRATITQDDVAGYYLENRSSFERVELYRIVVSDREVAQELRALVEEDDESFSLLAIEHSTNVEEAKRGGYVGAVDRSGVSGAVEAAVFGSAPGDLIGPVETDQGWEVMLVQGAWTVGLEDAATGIRDALFAELVAGILSRSDAARIETKSHVQR